MASMLILRNPVHAVHAPRQEMFRGRLVDCVEVPARQELVEQALRARGFAEWTQPQEPPRALLERIHAPAYLRFLESAWSRWIAIDPANADFDILPSVWPNHGLRRDVAPANFSAQVGLHAFDAGTPIMAGSWDAARAGAGCAIDAAQAVAGGRRCAMALTRPPGHHAGADFFGGYCLLNNAALAAQALRDAGMARVAVLDVDYHHGNGTQAIFDARADVFTISIHGDPATEYPFYLGYADERGHGDGEGANLNLPLAPGCDYTAWSQALEQGMQALRAWGAEAVVVALGVDTYGGDPISKFRLAGADYLRMGAAIARLRLPTVFVLEGGYAVQQVGVNVANVLEGFAQA